MHRSRTQAGFHPPIPIQEDPASQKTVQKSFNNLGASPPTRERLQWGSDVSMRRESEKFLSEIAKILGTNGVGICYGGI